MDEEEMEVQSSKIIFKGTYTWIVYMYNFLFYFLADHSRESWIVVLDAKDWNVERLAKKQGTDVPVYSNSCNWKKLNLHLG